MMTENCPHCSANMRGDAISEESLRKGYYGTWDGVTPQYYSRIIGIEVSHIYDGVAFWRCPDCGGEWPRKGMQWAWDATHTASSDLQCGPEIRATPSPAFEAALDAFEAAVFTADVDNPNSEWVATARAEVLRIHNEEVERGKV